MEDKLPKKYFLRIHRSFIVAFDKIEKYSQTSITVGGKLIPIGGLYKNEVLKTLNKKLI